MHIPTNPAEVKQLNLYTMKTEDFKNLESYIGKDVKFTYFIPSANRESEGIGVVVGQGKGHLSEHIVIGHRGKDVAIHYSRVTLL